MNKFKISHLRAMKKVDIYALCLKEFGNYTAGVYSHYTKSEMIDDLMSVTMSETVQTTDDTPTKTVQIELPFMGLYGSFHTGQPSEIMERALSDNAETLTYEQNDDFWRIFHTEFDYKKYHQKLANLYAHWLIHSLYDVTIADVELHCPREYNFTTDTITVTVNATLEQLDLTLDYFKCNPIDNDDTLLVETLAYIKEKYTSRDGFVSFVEPTPPTLESVFIEPAYLDCAFEIYTYHKFDMEYWNYRYLLNELDEKFIEYMHEQGHYDDLFWECLPKDLADYLQTE